METTKITKVAEVRPLPRANNSSSKNSKPTPRILSQAKITGSSTTNQPQPMTINLNAGQVLLPLVGTAAPQTATPIVLRCTIPQASISTNTLSSSTTPASSLTSSPNIIIQQLTTPSASNNVTSVPNLQILQPLLQNIIQQNQSSNIAKVIIMPPSGKQANSVSSPTLSTLLGATPSWQDPPEPIIRLPGYENVLPTKVSVPNRSSKTGPTCTVSKPPPTISGNTFSNLSISNVFSLKDSDNIDKTMAWDDAIRNAIINIDDDDDLDESNDDISNDDDNDLMRGDGHQVKAARRAAARIRKTTLKFPTIEESYCISAEQQREIPLQMRLSDDVEVYETIPEILTDVELGKYKPKSNSTSKILFASTTVNSHCNNPQSKNTKQTLNKAVVRPPPQKIPRLVPKTKGTPIIISSPTASRNVDDYIVPLAKCIPKDLDVTMEATNTDVIPDNDIKIDTKKKAKAKVPQWKVGYVKRRKKRKSASNTGTSVPSAPLTSSASQSPVAMVSTGHPTSKKSKDNSGSAGYSTIRSLLNAPVGHMVTRRTRSASNLEQDDIVEIDDKSEDSQSRPSSPSNLQGSGAKKQLRMMLLTKNKDKQDDDDLMIGAELDGDDLEVHAIMRDNDQIHSDGHVPDEEISNSGDRLQTLEYKSDNIVNKEKIPKDETDDEFKSDDEVPNMDQISKAIDTETVVDLEDKPKKKKSLKVKLSLKPTKRKGRRGRKSRKCNVESWNITTEFEKEETANKEEYQDSKEPEGEDGRSLADQMAAKEQQTLDNNPDEVATSGAEEEEQCVEDQLPGESGDKEDAKKKSKTHKHKRKSKRKRKRKKEEQHETEADDLHEEQTSTNEVTSSHNGPEPILSKLNNEHKILHLKEVLRQQQKQLDELRHRKTDKP